MQEVSLGAPLGASLWPTLLIGLALGLKHALDVDHVVAVSTLVARERNVWRSTLIGAVWGAGHTATLLAMGLLIIVLGLRISDGVARVLESGVALMLIFLGARTLWQWKTGRGHVCAHDHGSGSGGHVHFHVHGEHACALDEAGAAPKLSAKATSGRQSFLVGAVHGLSGSAELMLLVLATIREPLWALLYIGVFGLGMMAAMLAMTTLFSGFLSLSNRFQNTSWNAIDRGLRGLTGVASLGFGIHLAIQIAHEIA